MTTEQTLSSDEERWWHEVLKQGYSVTKCRWNCISGNLFLILTCFIALELPSLTGWLDHFQFHVLVKTGFSFTCSVCLSLTLPHFHFFFILTHVGDEVLYVVWFLQARGGDCIMTCWREKKQTLILQMAAESWSNRSVERQKRENWWPVAEEGLLSKSQWLSSVFSCDRERF